MSKNKLEKRLQGLFDGLSSKKQEMPPQAVDPSSEPDHIEQIFEASELAPVAPVVDSHTLSTIVESHPDFIGLGTLDGQLLYINPAGLTMLGFPPEYDVTGLTIQDIYPSTAAQRLQDEGLSVAMEEGCWVAEARLLKQDGATIPVEQKININYNAGGNPINFSITLRDISHQQKPPQMLIQQEDQLGLILNILPVSLLISRLSDDEVLFVNAQFGNLARLSPETLVGKPAPDIYDEGSVLDQIKAQLEAQEYVHNREVQLKRADGTSLWAVLSAQQITFDDQPALLTGLYDITPRKEAEVSTAKRAEALAIVAAVSTAAATILDTDKLLQEVVDLTKARFDLYHVHIYLLTENEDLLTLAAGAGLAGQEMVAQRWQIPIEHPDSIVAQVARTRQGTFTNDVWQAVNYLPNKLLPDTRAELAVPLISGDKVLGVLDIQSDIVGRFTNEDIGILSTLAAQVAIALQNARSFERSEQVRRDLDVLTRQLTFDGWHDYLNQERVVAFEYSQNINKVSPLEQSGLPQAKTGVDWPLVARGATIGQISLSQPEVMQDDVREILEAVSYQLSTHLETLRLTEQTTNALVAAENQAQRLTALSKMSASLTQAVELEEVFNLVSYRFHQIIGYDQATLLLMQDDSTVSQMYQLHAAQDATCLDPQPLDSDDLVTQVIQTKRLINIPDLTLEPPINDQQLLQQGFQSAVAVPLYAQGEQIMGVISLASRTPGAYDSGSEILLNQVASILGATLENRHLFEQTRRALADAEAQANQLALLNKLSQALNLTHNEQEVYPIVVQYMIQAWPSDRCSVALFIPDDQVELLILEDQADSELHREQISIQNTIFEKILQEKRLIVEQANLTDATLTGFPSRINAPLLIDGQVIGTINLARKDTYAFTTQDEILIQQVSLMVSTTVQSRRLLAQTEARAKREQILREVTTQIRSGTDVNTILRLTAQEVGRALGKPAFVRLENSPDAQHERQTGLSIEEKDA